MGLALIVLAKAPEAGRAKTRLCPPCSPAEAAALASAALADTLQAAAAAPIRARRVLVLDGHLGSRPSGWDVVPQRDGGLDERLAGAFADVGGPALLVGMDTPQVSGRLLSDAAQTLLAPGMDAVLGRATDGGYWAIGLRAPDPAALIGVPMSTAGTFAVQWSRLRSLGLQVGMLPELRDVDTIADARSVSASAPSTRFARALAALGNPARAGSAA